VEVNTAEAVNERIRREMEGRLARYEEAGREAIDARLRELDREWDIERTLDPGGRRDDGAPARDPGKSSSADGR
jgi:hypothetical protein